MKRVNLIILLAVFNLFLIQSIHAEIKLPAVVSSNMVLQRNTTIMLWGWADSKEEITINTSWLNEQIFVQADNQGNWRVEVKTNNSKESQLITLTSKTSNIKLENILFGEVWLCSGQSNMEQPVKGFSSQPTFGSNTAIVKSNNSNLRLFTVERFTSKTPLKELGDYKGWEQASPHNVSEFSAVAYFFGQQLQESLNCPVGIIFTSWGGTKVQSWISKEALSPYQNVNIDSLYNTEKSHQTPTVLFNAMVNPLIPYTIKGVLWYQGESNRKEPDVYKKVFPAMVKDWRTRWGIGDFPFYYVQIAPYSYNNYEAFQDNDNTAFIRESQLECLELIPNSGIVITLDLGDENWIHPPKKKQVADRLLFNALNQTYGYKTIDNASPAYESHEVKDGGIVVKFKNAEKGLYTYDGLKDFEIAGKDKIFYPANANIVYRKSEVLVKSDKVPKPVAVRYAWRNWATASLYDTYFLPASSFRTDDWTDATKAKD